MHIISTGIVTHCENFNIHLVGIHDTSIDVDEAFRVAIVDLIDNMVFLNPFWANFLQPFLVLSLTLSLSPSAILPHKNIFYYKHIP